RGSSCGKSNRSKAVEPTWARCSTLTMAPMANTNIAPMRNSPNRSSRGSRAIHKVKPTIKNDREDHGAIILGVAGAPPANAARKAKDVRMMISSVALAKALILITGVARSLAFWSISLPGIGPRHRPALRDGLLPREAAAQ